MGETAKAVSCGPAPKEDTADRSFASETGPRARALRLALALLERRGSIDLLSIC